MARELTVELYPFMLNWALEHYEHIGLDEDEPVRDTIIGMLSEHFGCSIREISTGQASFVAVMIFESTEQAVLFRLKNKDIEIIEPG